MKNSVKYSLLLFGIFLFFSLNSHAQVSKKDTLPEVSTIGIFDGILTNNAYKVNDYYISAFDIKPEQVAEMTGKKVSVSGRLKMKEIKRYNSQNNTEEIEKCKFIKGPFFIIIKDNMNTE